MKKFRGIIRNTRTWLRVHLGMTGCVYRAVRGVYVNGLTGQVEQRENELSLIGDTSIFRTIEVVSPRTM